MERHLKLSKELSGGEELSSSIHSLIEELDALCKGLFI